MGFGFSNAACHRAPARTRNQFFWPWDITMMDDMPLWVVLAAAAAAGLVFVATLAALNFDYLVAQVIAAI
jgi:hypothetical protein